jgi:hypothetical protein
MIPRTPRGRQSPPDGRRAVDATNDSRPTVEPLSTNGAADTPFVFEPWLTLWLVRAGFATQTSNGLGATPAGIEVGALLG